MVFWVIGCEFVGYEFLMNSMLLVVDGDVENKGIYEFDYCEVKEKYSWEL
jgi:hypothetical protein